MAQIEDKISKLEGEDKKKFGKQFYECLNDEDWCKINGINYLELDEEEDIPKARRIVYNQMVKRGELIG